MKAFRSLLPTISIFLVALPFYLPAQSPYPHGDPTDEEQLFLEFINQARASIDDEVDRLTNTTDPDVLDSIDFFNVDLALMATQFTSLKASNGNSQMPLAFNPLLIEASRLHSEDMFISVFQGHESSSNAISPNSVAEKHSTRIEHQGYDAFGSAENVFAASDSVWHGHAGFNIDWGNGPGGIQSPAGHRGAIHSNGRREAGIGVHLGNRDQSERPPGTQIIAPSSPFSDVGPILVTQVFARQVSSTGMDVPFLTGVSYLDIDGDQFYSLGEGLHGIRIEVEGASFYAETSASGGYAIPLPNQAGTYTLTVSGPGITTFTDSISVPQNLDNVKWDYAPSFSMPVPGGSSSPVAGSPSSYTFNTVPGASAYRVRVAQLDGSNWSEGAENGETNITITSTQGYPVIQSTTTASGSSAFRLATVSGSFDDQIIEIDREIIPAANSEIQYASRQGLTTSDQSSSVQVSTDGGTNWTPLETQSGIGSPQDGFSTRTVNLANYQNQTIRIRFVFSFPGGSLFPASQADSGWFIDDITVTNSSLVGETAHADFSAAEFNFTPPAAADFMLQATAVSGERIFPYGSALFVSATGLATGVSLAESLEGLTFFNEPDPKVYFANVRSFENDGYPNWRGLSGFGAFNILEFPWIFHAQMGYLYMFGPGGDDLFLYIPDLDAVCYTRPGTFFPYVYDYTHQHWWYLDHEGSTPALRHYYSFESDNEGWQSFSN